MNGLMGMNGATTGFISLLAGSRCGGVFFFHRLEEYWMFYLLIYSFIQLLD